MSDQSSDVWARIDDVPIDVYTYHFNHAGCVHGMVGQIKKVRFLTISRFLGRILIEHIVSKYSTNSKLQPSIELVLEVEKSLQP